MQWTPELNSLLNQSVFASGYDFDAACELFCQQANKLKLWTGGEELVLSGDQCQEQWMALNPTEEDEDEDTGEEDPETTTEEVADAAEEESGYVFVPHGGPRLELSLSDAELDQLLSTLPPSEEPEDASAADAKDPQNQSRSEMQWVLAFLTDPDAIATVDADAKNLVGSTEKLDDDNYQVFLQDLHDANLMAPISSGGDGKRDSRSLQQETVSPAVNDEDSSSDESEADWERTRQAMKQSLKFR